jgi:hypothetical protein
MVMILAGKGMPYIEKSSFIGFQDCRQEIKYLAIF